MGKERCVRVLYETVKVVVGHLKKYKEMESVVKTLLFFGWKLVMLLVSPRCDIPEASNKSAVRNGVVVKSFCFRFIVTEENIISGEWAASGSVLRTR